MSMHRQLQVLFFCFSILGYSVATTVEICAIYAEHDGIPIEEQTVGLTRIAVDEVNSQYDFNIDLNEGTFSSSDDAFQKLSTLQSCLTTNTVAVIGPRSSQDVVLISPVLNPLGIPLISPTATSALLTDDVNFPFFSRTIQSDVLQAEAIVDLIRAYGWKNVAMIHQQGEPYGDFLAQELETFSSSGEINIAISEGFDPDVSFPSEAVDRLKDSGVNIFVVLSFEEQAIDILHKFLLEGLLGGENVVILSEAAMTLLDSLPSVSFLNATEKANLEAALSGILGVQPSEGSGDVYDALDQKWSTFDASTLPQSPPYDIGTTGLPSILGNFPGQLSYDAVLALADSLFRLNLSNVVTGEDLIAKIRNTTNLEGASGILSIDATGNRVLDFDVLNFQSSPGSGPVAVGTWSESSGLSPLATVFWANGQNSTTFTPGDNFVSPGVDDCPCIDPFENETFAGSPNPSFPLVNVNGSSSVTSLSVDYGAIGCAPHDVVLPECTGSSSVPFYCEQSWCYVDVDNCNRFVNQNERVKLENFTGLFRSYTTCQNLEGIKGEARAERLSALGTLRVSYPGSSGTYTLVNNGNGDVSGSFPDFWDRIISNYSIDIELVNISQQSFEEFPLSSYSACVHEVALNNTDICIADHFMTVERRALSTFVSTIYDASFKVISFKTETESGVKGLQNPLEVFEWEVWFSVFVSLIYGALAVFYVDVVLFNGQRKGIISFIFFGLSTFTAGGAGGDRFEAKRLSTHVIVAMLSFLSLIFTALFTAQMTSNFVLSGASLPTEYSGIDDVLDQEKTICMLQSVQEPFNALYASRNPSFFLVQDSYVGVLESMDSGDCDVGLITEDEYQLMIRGGASTNPKKHCNKDQVGNTVLTISASVPVNPTLQSDLSWVVEEIILQYEEDVSVAQAAFFSSGAVCSSVSIDTDTALQVKDISFIFLIYGILVTGIVLLATCRQFTKAKEARMRKK